MSYLHDEIDDGAQRHSGYNAPSRELTLSTPAILGIFFGLALLCAVFFGFGYNMGSKSHQAPIVASTPTTPAATNFDSFKPRSRLTGACAVCTGCRCSTFGRRPDRYERRRYQRRHSCAAGSCGANVPRSSSGSSFPSRSFRHSGIRDRPYVHGPGRCGLASGRR